MTANESAKRAVSSLSGFLIPALQDRSQEGR